MACRSCAEGPPIGGTSRQGLRPIKVKVGSGPPKPGDPGNYLRNWERDNLKVVCIKWGGNV